jgi:uncharacterized protein YgbK (DUF1537 family)
MGHVSLREMIAKYENHNFDSLKVPDLLAEEINKNKKKLIILEDDLDGFYLFENSYVCTNWTEETIRNAFLAPEKVFHILTNTRSLLEMQTIRIHCEIANNIIEISRELKQEFLVICRGDSKLRGHYPLETLIIMDLVELGTESNLDGEILFPFCKEEGCFTVDDIHYIEKDGILIPVADTNYAFDTSFSYSNSNLCNYIQEKTKGRYPAKEVVSISLNSLRAMEFESITNQLMEVHDFGKVVVNALDNQDVKVFCIALYRAMAKGKNFVVQSATSFVKNMIGI